jgi:hypothetical protein
MNAAAAMLKVRRVFVGHGKMQAFRSIWRSVDREGWRDFAARADP